MSHGSKASRWCSLSGKWTQHTEDETFALSSAHPDDVFQGDAEEAWVIALVDLTVEEEEGAFEELRRVDIPAEKEYSFKNAMMDDHKGSPVNLCIDSDSKPKALPRVDDHIDEENVETDEEQLDQEAPVPRPFDLDEENMETDEEQLEHQATVPESEQTAENGWIVILQNSKVPYDQDADPAGLYGGREVDDRPSLLDFYHQDARTNGHFAKMAPTKADLAAKKTAAMLAKRMIEASDSDAAASRLQAAPTTSVGVLTGKPVLRLRPPKAPSNESNPLPFRAIANVSFSPGTKKESAREKVMNIFNKWHIANNAKAKDIEHVDYRKAFLARKQDEQINVFGENSDDGGPLRRTKSIREWIPDPADKSKRFLRITNPSAEADADDEHKIAKSSVEVDDDSDLEKAIAASLEPLNNETQQKKATGPKENIGPGIQQTIDVSVAYEIKANADFHDQFAIIHRSKAEINAASNAEEEADLERAIWESMQVSPDKKRKSSFQSLADDGSSEESEARTVERGWVAPKGGEKRSSKRLSSPRKVARG